jgi:hypothetical protein
MKSVQKLILAAALVVMLTLGAASAADAFSRRSSDQTILTRTHDAGQITLVKQKKSNNEYEGQF